MGILWLTNIDKNRKIITRDSLISEHPKNIDAIACTLLGDNVLQEPALNSILRITLRTSSTQEYFAVDYVFKCFCEKNSDGQTMLASTLIPQPQSMIHAPLEEDVNMSFGSMLLRSLTLSENNGDLEVMYILISREC
ncbi:golgin candidate 6-like [Cucurbita moschata]|uniref:Golgin candidate 6-like n=1 Tax=Cucurbita moschata TaxID=3662 RepID=A0A6J1FKU4_CUCMO|nr:golgin candidate 6-like [Cucurbita moschata]